VQHAAAHQVLPPVRLARLIALALSTVAVVFSLACGFCGRRAYALREGDPDALLPWTFAFLVLLLIALLLRMASALCELWWLERTWSNIPEPLRKVGPVKDVSSGMAVVITFIPGVAWIWKLGVVVGIANGFEAARSTVGFTAPVPRAPRHGGDHHRVDPRPQRLHRAVSLGDVRAPHRHLREPDHGRAEADARLRCRLRRRP
jgi:hypothetical protein